MRIHAVVFAVALVGSSALAGEQTISIDFGASGRTTPDVWNNITEPTREGVVLEYAQDSDGVETSVHVRQVDGWASYNVNGHREAGPFPSTAKEDSFYLEQGRDTRAKLRIEGLTAGMNYRVEIFASRMGDDARRTGRYTIGDKKLELNASNNSDKTIVFDNVPSDDGGALELTVECPDDQRFAYLGVLTITGSFGEPSDYQLPVEPLDGPPVVSAKAWAVADGKTGEILWGANMSAQRHMASTTKIMTAWIVLELAREDPDILTETAVVSEVAGDTGGTSAKLEPGEKILVSDLLYGLLLPSGNDAAVALAEHFGSRLSRGDAAAEVSAAEALEMFVAEMNRRAADLGMQKTLYLDPHGNSANRSSARDLLKLAWRAMQNEAFRRYVRTRRHRCEITARDGSRRERTWTNSNQLLDIRGYDGIKTGTTGGAGACLVSSGQRGDDRLLLVVLGSTSKDGRFVDSRNLYRWAWKKCGHE